MSTLGFDSSNTNYNSNNMSIHSFFEFKKQASFYIKEKIKTARLVLTDVTPAQLMTEEATNAEPWSPDTRTLGLISRAAFEVDDYWRIVDILHNKFNWGLSVRKKSERVLKLLDKGPLLKEERSQARKLTREIKGFGSFSARSASPHSPTTYGRSHSQFNEHGNEENLNEKAKFDQPQLISLGDDHVKAEVPQSVKMFLKENQAPRNELRKGDWHVWNYDNVGEKNALLDGKESLLIEEDDHPFNDTTRNSRVSLLATAKED